MVSIAERIAQELHRSFRTVANARRLKRPEMPEPAAEWCDVSLDHRQVVIETVEALLIGCVIQPGESLHPKQGHGVGVARES